MIMNDDIDERGVPLSLFKLASLLNPISMRPTSAHAIEEKLMIPITTKSKRIYSVLQTTRRHVSCHKRLQKVSHALRFQVTCSRGETYPG